MLRKPLTVVKQVIDTNLTGTLTYDFDLPQDIDSIVVKLYTGTTFSGTTPTADVYVHTTDDGGTTFYDCVHFDQISGAISLANAKFALIPVSGAAANTPLGKGYTGSVAASTIGTASVSGLPLLSGRCRIAIVYGGTVGVNSGIIINVLASTQSAHA